MFKTVNILKKLIDNKRFQHSLRVAKEAKKLAKHWGENKGLCFLAGLLHDSAKNLSPEKLNQYKIIKKKHNIYNKYPKTWHALIAPTVIRKLFKIKQKSVLSASKWHCTGKQKMNLIEKIVFIADYIEPERKNENLEKIRKTAYENLDLCMHLILDQTVKHLEKNNKKINRHTLKALKHYKNKQK